MAENPLKNPTPESNPPTNYSAASSKVAAYPNNSNKAKEAAAVEATRKTVSPVIEGTATLQKKSMFRRFSDTFLGDDPITLGKKIFRDVAVVAVKKALSDIVNNGSNALNDIIRNGTEILLFGEVQQHSPRDSRGYTNYSAISSALTRPNYNPSNPTAPPLNLGIGGSGYLNDVIVPTLWEANEVIDHMYGILADSDTHTATIVDLYSLVKLPFDFTQESWGWRDLTGMTYRQLRDGRYAISMPRPTRL